MESILAAFGGLNQDDSLISPPNGEGLSQIGDYRYARNVRIGSSTENNTGGVENIQSTLDVSSYYYWDGSAFVSGTVPSGTNVAKGKFEDKDEGKLYWAVYNSSGNHQILVFDKATRNTYEMLKWSGLGFTATTKVSMCRINKYLIFTDNINPPRIAAWGLTDPTKDIYHTKYVLGSSFSEYHISFAKWPPLAPPFIWSNYNGTASAYLTKFYGQFAYRYIFYGGFRSVWSPPSSFVSAQFQPINISLFYMNVPGFTFNYETPASTAYANTDVRFYQFVEFIDFAYRESTRDGWKTFKRYSVALASVSDLPASFDNNGPSARIAQTDIGQYFDTVPLLSETCEAIDNRTMFGNNLDDLTRPTFAVDNIEVYSITSNNVTDISTWFASGASFSSLSGGEQTVLEVQTNCKQFSFKERGIYKGGMIFQHYNGRTSLVCTQDDWTYLIRSRLADNSDGSEYLHALGFKIPNSITPPDWAVAYQFVRSNCLNIDYFVEGYVNDFKFLQSDANGFTDWLQTPTEIKSILNELANSSSGKITAPTSDQLADPSFDTNAFLKAQLSQSGNDIELSKRITAAIRKSKIVASSANCGYIYMDISNWYLTSSVIGGASDNPSNNLFYNYKKGDRVTFFGSASSSYTNSDLILFDEEIVEFTGQGIIVKRPPTLVTLKTRTQEANTGHASTFLIEIYTPKKINNNDDILFYECGEWYPITQPTTSSRDFSKRDFTWTDPASVTVSSVAENRIYNKMPIYEGDVSVVKKPFYFTPDGGYTGATGTIKFIQMNCDKDNAAGFWEHNSGRPFVAYQYAPQILRKTTQVRFGSKFLEDSIFISINNFKNDWQFIYPSEYGTIRKLINTSNAQVESVGNILLALGEREAWSIYVNRTTLEDLSGRTQVGVSDRVLGSYNTLLGSQGTLNPESVTSHNGKVIWWNAKKGVWNRYSRDGITEISQIKMKNWFKDLSYLLIDQYATATVPKVISVYDNYHDEWITRFDHSTLPSTFKGYDSYKCMSFAERPADKRWKSVYDYAPDLFAALDNDVYSIIGSKIYIHEAGTDFGKFYGSSVLSQIEFAVTDNPRQVKDFRVVTLVATDSWSFEKIMGDWKSNSATIQETRIPITSLAKLENSYWAEIKRDKNSPNSASQTIGVVSGNPIKTNTLRLLLQLDSAVTYLSVLHWLCVDYDMSEKNPKK